MEKFICPVCNVEFVNVNGLMTHVTKLHYDKRTEVYDSLNLKCLYCSKKLDLDTKFGNFCCQLHYNSYNKKDDIKYVCEFCGSGYKKIGGLQQHFGKIHKEINQEEYYRKHFLKDGEGYCLWCKKEMKFHSFTNGYNKFCYNTDCNVKWYNENTDRIKVAAKSTSERFKNDKSLVTTNKEYWIVKGYSEQDAILKIKDRQTTFTKQKCIDKYGSDKGLEVWKNRQDKWLKSYKKLNYSNISQDLFWKLYEYIKNNFKEVYFATNHSGHRIDELNNEFRLKTINSCRKLDFYIPELKKCIEFDGSYWHGEVGIGNVERDFIREQEIISTIPEIKIKHVKEMDYKSDPDTVINECLEFIYGE